MSEIPNEDEIARHIVAVAQTTYDKSLISMYVDLGSVIEAHDLQPLQAAYLLGLITGIGTIIRTYEIEKRSLLEEWGLKPE